MNELDVYRILCVAALLFIPALIWSLLKQNNRLFDHHESMVREINKVRGEKHALANELNALKLNLFEKNNP